MDQGTFKTTDGGLTWSNTKLPLYPDGSMPIGIITQIRMTSPLDGWLTCQPFNTEIRPAVYRTSDGGQSWQPTLAIGRAGDVWVTPTAVLATRGNAVGIGNVSLDGGLTYSPGLDTTDGIYFVDNLHGVATGFQEHPWYRTSDGGRTWIELPSDTTETWGIYGVTGTPWFFTAGEGDGRRAEPSTFKFSSDYGTTWTTLPYNLPYRTTGDIAGHDFLLYVQMNSFDGKVPGLWRSKDTGKTWVPVGGPVNKGDTRFIVLGCRGEVIYAFDTAGNVWKTTDGGDGSMPQFALESKAIFVDSIDACHPRDTTVSIRNLGCDTIDVTSASTPATPPLTILDPATGQPPAYPIVVLPDSSASFTLELQAVSVGAYQSDVVLHLLRQGVSSYDTIAVTSALRFMDPVRSVSSGLQFDSTSLCSTNDTDISIADSSCFSIYIVNCRLKYGTNYILDTAWANDSIGAYSSKKFSIRFAPSAKGRLTDSLIVNLGVFDRPERVSIPLSGVAKANNPLLVMMDAVGDTLPSVINFDTMTRCQDSNYAFTVREEGCDSLYVALDWLDSTMTESPPVSEFNWTSLKPVWLTQDGTPTNANIGVIPTSAQGSYQGYLRITDSIKDAASKTVQIIPYRVFIKPGSRILSVDSSTRVFDTMAFCDTRDTVITIRNDGCDTLHISKLYLSTSNYFFSSALKTPLKILPYDSLADTLHYVPTISGQALDTITIVTSDSIITRHIPIVGYATPTDTVRFRPIANEQNVKPGDTATVVIMPNGAFMRKGLSNILLTIAYNSDVMTPFNTSAATTGVRGAGAPFFNSPLPIGGKVTYLPITIAGSGLTFDSTTELLRMQFLVTLSDSSHTDFRIARIQLNNGDPVFTKCALGGIADTATVGLDFVCGDSIMYNFLRGAQWGPSSGIAPGDGSAYPNPVQRGQALIIPFRTLRNVSVRLTIVDAKGSCVYSGEASITRAGSEEFVVPSLLLSSGSYHYTLDPIGAIGPVISGDFIVTK